MPKLEMKYVDSIVKGAIHLKHVLQTIGKDAPEVELPEITIDEIKELDSDLWALIDFLESGDYREFMEDEAGEEAMDELETQLAMENVALEGGTEE